MVDAGGDTDAARVEDELIAIVGGLLSELGAGPGRRPTRRDSLDRDLGLGSLERVELLLRIEDAFRVRLADDVMVAADTVADLATAVLAGGPKLAEAPPAATPPIASRGGAAPRSTRSLVEALAWQAEHNPDAVHLMLREDGGDERRITYRELWTRARSVAAALRRENVGAGQTVSLMLRTEEAFFTSFFGVLLAGGVPVPIYPPFRLDRLEEYARRQEAILRNAQVTLLVTFREAARVAGLLRAGVPSLRRVVSADRLATPPEAGAFRPATGDPALIQYTSGSTGEPKGVLLSHANVLANVRAIGEALDLRPDDVGVSWLPLYHDMGLIGTWLAALYFGVPIAVMSPLAFLSRPSRWLWSVHAHRGTISPAPNFAYELCARRIPDAEVAGLDLSSWRLALNGAEAVNPDTIERFTRRFAPYGLRAEAMCPVYGLAESSVALTVPPLGRLPRVERLAREPFQTARRAVAAAASESAPLRFVSCGRAIPGHEVRIVDPDGRPLGDRRVGRIEFRGPSVTAGYYRRPDATRAVVRDGWMDSGDLGYLADGELFVTGRQKDLIIKGGRNLHPEEVEEAAGDVPGIRTGCVAAFSVPDPALGTERLVVVAESRATDAEARERLRVAVVDRVVAGIGIPPDTVVVAAPRSVRKTSSGKIRRGATRDAYLAGRLEVGRLSLAGQWARVVARELAARARRVARGGGAVLFGAWVAGVLLMSLPVLWIAVWMAPPGEPTRRVVRRGCRLLLRACLCPLRVGGEEHLAGLDAAVLCANHASYLDAVVLLAALPVGIRVVAMRELRATPLIRTIIRKSGHLTVERADVSRSLDDARAVVEALRAGATLLVFPEGGFGNAPGLRPFRLGAFKAAVESGKPVVPVAVAGTRAILGGGRVLPRRGRVAVTIAAPLPPQGDGWPEMVRLRDATRARIAAVTGEPISMVPGPPDAA